MSDAQKLRKITVSGSGDLDLFPLGNHLSLDLVWATAEGMFHNFKTLTLLPEFSSLVLIQSSSFTNLNFLTRLHQLTQLGLGPCQLSKPALHLLTELRSLNLINGSVDGGLITLADVRPELNSLTLEDCGELPDLSPLATLTNLRRLDLPRCIIGPLDPLKNLPYLTELDLSGVQPDLDLSPLADCRLIICLGKDQQVTGLDRLGPGITIKRLR
ncbi:MAG TPA: hypothetical protein VFX70_21875 [Mycobacteriales bacterium]|nr:hypothetical protein [Mycobacteriales bacterium]